MADIRLKCGKCEKTLKVPEKFAGRVVACPACKQKLRVPEPAIMEAQLADEPPVRPPARPKKKAAAPATTEKPRKMGVGEWIVAVLLAPVGVIMGLLWAVKRDRRWMPMLATSGLLSLVAGGVLYSQSDNLMGWLAWEGQEDRITNKPEDFVGLDQMNLEQGGGGSSDGTPYRDESQDDGGVSDEEWKESAERAQKEVAKRANRVINANIKPPTEAELVKMSPPIQRACRANVAVEALHGNGSGVICQIEGDQALILTNRHVVDSTFTSRQGFGVVGNPMLADIPKLEILYVDGSKLAGGVTWIAPDGVDLALIRAKCPTDKIAEGDWRENGTASLGEEVFTVGNPVGYGWTYTAGKVSAVRDDTRGSERAVPVFQVDATISPGNSGGGLYNQAGKLIGINTYIVNPSIAQNLGFAIRTEFLNELKPPKLNLQAKP